MVFASTQTTAIQTSQQVSDISVSVLVLLLHWRQTITIGHQNISVSNIVGCGREKIQLGLSGACGLSSFEGCRLASMVLSIQGRFYICRRAHDVQRLRNPYGT